MSLMVQPYVMGEKLPGDYEQIVNYTMLYDEGDECTDVTGGWSAARGSITKNVDSISFGGGSSSSEAATANMIDVSSYSLLCENRKLVTDKTGGTEWFGLYNARNGQGDSTTVKKTQSSGTYNGLNTLDISDIATTCFILHGVYLRTYKLYHSFLVKPDDYRKLCSKAGLGVPSSLNALIADTTALATIFNNEDAVKFMVAQCTGDFMVSVCNSATAMAALVNSIAYDYAFENEHWYKFMKMIPTALAAMDSVAVTVPTMTSNTTPSGVASASSMFNAGNDAWRGFDKSVNTCWGGAKGQIAVNSWLAYTWSENAWNYKLALYKVEVSPVYMSGYRGDCLPSEFKIQGLDDNGEWVDIEAFKTKTTTSQASAFSDSYVLSNPLKAYKGYRLYVTGAPAYGSGGDSLIIGELQFYGKAVN